MFRQKISFLVFAALLLISPAPIHAWRWMDSGLKRVSLPISGEPLLPLVSADFEGDNQPETLSLANGRAAILSSGQIRWQSPSTWQVRQAEIADLNRDGLPEAVLLVWRPFKPWPVDRWLSSGGRINGFHDSAGNSCHLILIGWQKNTFRERWAGSALAEPPKSFAVADLSGTGEKFLVTLEAEYDDLPSAPARQLKIWEWNGFGFSLVSKLPGPFGQFVVIRDANGRQFVLLP